MIAEIARLEVSHRKEPRMFCELVFCAVKRIVVVWISIYFLADSIWSSLLNSLLS